MKKIVLTISLVITLLTTSCNTQKIIVNGEPGTVITTVDGQTTLAVIDQSGTAEIKMKRKEYYIPFLQAKAPNSNELIPFALDYENHNRTTPNWIIGFAILVPVGYLGPSYIFFNRSDSKFDYDYLEQQQTNNDLIR